MDVIIKINNQTAGRDKIARLLQYISRFLWHRLQLNHKEGVSSLKNVEFQLSTFRKFLRFGRFAESLYATLPLFHEDRAAIKYALTLSKIANSLFLLADHVLLLGRADFCTIDTEKWSRLSNKYWLYSITMNLVRDFYEILFIIKTTKSSIVPSKGIQRPTDVLGMLLKLFYVLRNHPDVVTDTIKNSCDFFIPLTALGHVKLSPGTIGLLGAISSLAGLLVVVDPKKKLIPQ